MMKKWAYYNDNDPFVCGWARNLIRARLVPDGEVDCRSILSVEPSEIKGFAQAHFFCGILGWPYALELAGWGDREIWSASCPCQPLSSAGQRKGHVDERHLWPAFYRLVAECRPATIFGEQVASKDGREWLAGVRADLEALGYAVGAADLCAAGAGAPHIRQRLFWVADNTNARLERPTGARLQGRGNRFASGRATGGMADATGSRHFGSVGRAEGDTRDETRLLVSGASGATGGLADARRERSWGERFGSSDGAPRIYQSEGDQRQWLRSDVNASSAAISFWSNAEWLPCLDGKARRIEPGTFPLVDGALARVGRLRGYGNAIVPQVAAEFISSYMECLLDVDA